MEEAERYKPLDFRKIHELERIPKFELTRGNLTAKEREGIREKIREKLAKKKAGQRQDNTFTPPEYDDVYLEGMEKLSEENE